MSLQRPSRRPATRRMPGLLVMLEEQPVDAGTCTRRPPRASARGPSRSGCQGVPMRLPRIERLNAAAGRGSSARLGSSVAGSRSTSQAQRAGHRRLAALAQDVLRHRPVRQLREAGPVERGQQRAGVAVAEPGLGPRRRAQRRHHRSGEPAGAIAAAGEPHRVEGRARWRPRSAPRRASRRRRRSGPQLAKHCGWKMICGARSDSAPRQLRAPARRPPATKREDGRDDARCARLPLALTAGSLDPLASAARPSRLRR